MYAEACIGRVASHPDHRKEKLGHHMMEYAMTFIANQFGNPPVRISAQSHLCNFYAKYGFIKTGNEYLEDGIPHSEMIYVPQK
ncbi:MAG: GNAT family N-acetyltransferase [Crocinitomicaceae bacterium]|nr:GNAT family N-acetyltransferase [Crocinitomicaceae bacterium]